MQQLSPQIATETVQSVRLPFPLHVNIRLKDTLTVVALLFSFVSGVWCFTSPE
jgi:hypothetical protein